MLFVFRLLGSDDVHWATIKPVRRLTILINVIRLGSLESWKLWNVIKRDNT